MKLTTTPETVADSVRLFIEGADVVTGGTDTPLLLVDLRRVGLTGAEASESLERAGLTCNKNGVPGDNRPPSVTSGLRFGVSAGTTRGFGTSEFTLIGQLIADLLDGLSRAAGDMAALEKRVESEVRQLTKEFPIYGHTR